MALAQLCHSEPPAGTATLPATRVALPDEGVRAARLSAGPSLGVAPQLARSSDAGIADSTSVHDDTGQSSPWLGHAEQADGHHGHRRDVSEER
jgi:hypothetical protein